MCDAHEAAEQAPGDASLVLNEQTLVKEFRKIKGWDDYLSSIKQEFVNHCKSILAEAKECIPIKSEVVNMGRKVEDAQCRGVIREATYKDIWDQKL
ncbi:hypothetical protein QQ045_017557 [Rhodiola kirilowii]